MSEQRCGFIAVVGKPNAGKSSFLNWISDEKLTLVSKKANATRRRTNIIVIHENNQLVFVDTPGLHEKERLLNEFMMDEALKAIGDSDIILFLAPAHDSIKEYEKFLILNKKNTPHIILLTKADMVSQKELLDKLSQYNQFSNNFSEIIPISTKKNFIKKSYILEKVSKYLPMHPFLFDEDFLTTEPIREIYKEFIREAIFEYTSDEIPYFADAIVEKIEEKENIDHVYIKIIVEKDTQKAIIIGKDGANLKKIGKYSRILMEKIVQKTIFLHLFVTTEPNWTKNQKILSKLGYNFSEFLK